uniref:Uncharacterized protein n=1 Tax=Fagus sylvatica TaxID=28930 RepID=A0A2N9HMN7_FAGSY
MTAKTHEGQSRDPTAEKTHKGRRSAKAKPKGRRRETQATAKASKKTTQRAAKKKPTRGGRRRRRAERPTTAEKKPTKGGDSEGEQRPTKGGEEETHKGRRRRRRAETHNGRRREETQASEILNTDILSHIHYSVPFAAIGFLLQSESSARLAALGFFSIAAPLWSLFLLVAAAVGFFVGLCSSLLAFAVAALCGFLLRRCGSLLCPSWSSPS